VTRLLLVRHAEPGEDDRARCCGRTDVELCASGHTRARELAAALAHEPIAAIYTSPLRRARATAAPLAARLGLEPVVVDDLRELDFRELDGGPFDEIAARYPQLVPWTDAPAGVAFPGGESVAAAGRRAVAAVGAIRGRHPDGTAAVFAHGVVLRAALADALGQAPDALFRISLDYGGVSVVEWYGERPLVRLVNAPPSALRPPA
jgi:probable phosphoglycerate mutase